MDDVRLGLSVRALRHRRGWRQVDLAARAGVSAGLVGLVERGRADQLTVASLRRVARAVDLQLSWDVGSRAVDVDRLRDADHSAMAEVVAHGLVRLGWVVVPEVSFNRYGDRGRIDLFAFHPVHRTGLVIEIKTLIIDLQELLGRLDVKSRVAPYIARHLGWPLVRTVPALMVCEGTTNRRRLAEYPHLLGRLPLRGRSALAWLKSPSSTPQGILLLRALPHRNRVDARRAGRQRMRLRGVPLSTEGAAGISLESNVAV